MEILSDRLSESKKDSSYISIENLSVCFVDKTNKKPNYLQAIKNLTLYAKRGEIVSIIGPSGCGKTTLLKAISGILSWETSSLNLEGMIKIGDKKAFLTNKHSHIDNTHTRTINIGFIFQSPTLLEWRTVLENIRLPGEIMHNNEMIEKSEEYSQLVGLSKFNNAYPKELSGGMNARVSIARALVHQPEVLLMDESFSSLDEITREEMHEELIRIWMALNPTILFVTHSIPEAVFLSNRVAVMSKYPGRILKEFEIKFGFPRKNDLKDSADFMSIAREIRVCLEEEMHS